MEYIIFALLVGGFLFFTAIILPWIVRSRVQEVHHQMTVLKKQVTDLCRFLDTQGIKVPDDITSPLLWPWQCQQPAAARMAPAAAAPAVAQEAPQAAPLPTPTTDVPDETPSAPRSPRHGFEQQFGARLPVWIGGVALALAGFFLVRYSIEIGLLSPGVRVLLGLLFGGGLLYAADGVRARPQVANGTRIAQALSGAGIADLYVCLFAATSLYELIPAFIGFPAMAAVTLTAVLLSLRHGMPIALLGLVGGFLTPALVGSHDPHAPVLFLYLYFLVTGLMVVSRNQGWWGLTIPTVCGAFLWVCLWLFGSTASGDAFYLGLFLLAVSATVTTTARKQSAQAPRAHAVLQYLTLGGAVGLMGLVTAQSGFGMMEWGLFGLLALGTIALAYGDQRTYGFAPWFAMAVNAVMLLAWHPADIGTHWMTIIAFGTLYATSGYLLQSRSERPLLWAGLASAASLTYYLIAYYSLYRLDVPMDLHSFWSFIALAFAAFGAYQVRTILRDVPSDHPQKNALLASHCATGTAFVALALVIALPHEYLSVAFALQLLAIVWIDTRLHVKALRFIAGVLACVFAVLLLPQILLLVQLTAYSLMEAKLTLQNGIPMVDWPLLQLGVPALCFIAASILLRRLQDGTLVRAFEVAAIALIAVMGYYLTRHAFHVDQNVLFVKAGFIERGVITNILFLYGLVCLGVGRHVGRKAVSLSGLILAGIALFRLGYFDLIAYNPLWSAQAVGDLPILNALLLTYGLPILWLRRTVTELPHMGMVKLGHYAHLMMLLFAFVLISLSVRQLFHGTYLNNTLASNAEIYSYSVAWLTLGIGMLFYGTLRSDRMIRIASLAVMILTVGKVFLYDASELEGLFRVFSFFGLGLSLIGLSWFYTRFLFAPLRDA